MQSKVYWDTLRKATLIQGVKVRRMKCLFNKAINTFYLHYIGNGHKAQNYRNNGRKPTAITVGYSF